MMAWLVSVLVIRDSFGLLEGVLCVLWLVVVCRILWRCIGRQQHCMIIAWLALPRSVFVLFCVCCVESLCNPEILGVDKNGDR